MGEVRAVEKMKIKNWRFKVKSELDITLLAIEKCKKFNIQYPNLGFDKKLKELSIKAGLLDEELSKN